MVGRHLLSNLYFRIARRRNFSSENNSSNYFQANETETDSTASQMNSPIPSELEGAVALVAPDSDASMESLTSIADGVILTESSSSGIHSDRANPLAENAQNNTSTAASLSLSVDAVSQTVSNVIVTTAEEPSVENQIAISQLTAERPTSLSPITQVRNVLSESPEVTIEQINKPAKNELDSRFPNYEVEAMGSVFREVFICPICQCEYCIDTDDPRTLKCGHSLCSICLQRLYETDNNEVECAECRTNGQYSSITDIPIAFTVKQIIAKYKEKKQELNNPKTVNENLVIHRDENQEIESITNENSFIALGSCEEHSLPVHFGCTSCEEWLCGTCVCLNHTGQSNYNCKVYQINEALQRKRNNLMEKLTADRENLRLKKLHECQLKKDASVLMLHAEILNQITEAFLKDIKEECELHEKQEIWYRDIDKPLVSHLAKLSAAESASEVKETIDDYFNYKKSFKDSSVKNELFNKWRHFIDEASEELEKQSSFAVVRKSVDGDDGFVIVKARKNVVLLEFKNIALDQFSDSGNLIMETPFFNLSKNTYYAFIVIGRRRNDEYARITFLLDNNPLADAFLSKCSNGKHSFAGTRIYIPCRGSSSICFGQKIPTDSRKMVEIGNRSRYLKPICRGTIGVFNNFENKDEVDVNNMLVYINMLSSDDPRRSDVHYITNDGEPKLKMGFGLVYEGFEDIECFMDEPNEPLMITDSGVFIEINGEDDD